MDNAKFWWSSSATPQPPGPVVFGQSLRFRGVSGQKLVGTSAVSVSDTYTLSFWYKHTLNPTRYRGSIFTNDGGSPYLSFNADNASYSGIEVYGGSSGYVLYPPNGVGSFRQLRDPSAWYHCVITQVDSTSFTIYINGEQAFTTSTQCDWSNFALGGHLTTQHICDGFIADLYHIDGQALQPTAFGSLNTEGVWIPREDPDFNGVYGTNGFRLDFSDPNDLGADRSGNGNDFTATGFNTTAPVAITGSYADPTQLRASGGAVGTGTTTPAYIENVVPDNALGDHAGLTPSWAKIFDGDIGSAPTWYGTQYAGNPQVVEFDLRDFTADGVTSVEIWDTYASPNPRPFQVYLLDSSRNKINGSDWVYDAALGGPNGGWQNVPVPAGSSPAYIKFDCNNAWAIIRLAGIRVNGTFLAQNANPNPDFDLVADSPTQNWSTLNPLFYAPDNTQTFSNANLKIKDSDASFPNNTPPTIVLTGRKYWEITIETVVAQYPQIGVSRLNERNQNNQDYKFSSCYVPVSGIAGRNFDQDLATWVTVANGDVVGVDYNADTKEITWTKNGGDAFTVTVRSDDDLTPYLGSAVNSIASVNFGQQPFLYRPAGLTDANSLQTQNLLEAPITDGREHFQAITGPGTAADNGVAGQVVGAWSSMLYNTSATAPNFNSTTQVFNPAATFGFNGAANGTFYVPSGQRWIWRPDTAITDVTKIEIYCGSGNTHWINENPLGNSTPAGGQYHTIYDGAAFTLTNLAGQFGPTGAGSSGFAALRINDEIYVDGSILALAQDAFLNGLWWIKSRVVDGNTNQHQLVDSVRGGNLALTCPTDGQDTAYTAPAGNSVAWCWNAGGAAVTNNDGSITSQVSANTDAGFSIVTYSGQASNFTWGHGLNAEPEFVIIKPRTFDAGWSVYHQSIGPTQRVQLQQNIPVETMGYFQNIGPTETTFAVNTNVGVGGAGHNYVAYCWSPIPGYSAFGSFQANNSNDGPFIFLGFRPALLICKGADNSENWVLLDSTRGPTNLNSTYLMANVPQEEKNGSSFILGVDFLSNGFKCRGNNNINTGTGRYVYAAWAENPFGGSNVSPANAR